MKHFFIFLLISLFGLTPIMAGSFYLNVNVRLADKLIREHEGKGDLVLLDVRKPGEFAGGYINIVTDERLAPRQSRCSYFGNQWRHWYS